VKKYLTYILILIALGGCSVQKNTWLSRGYHNLTARYNILFNGVQSFEEGRERMRETVKNDYTSVLPMFAYCAAAGGEVPASQMNRAIRKGQKLIEKHSITAKPRREPSGSSADYRNFYNQHEFNRWVDDAWMLIGKAHIYSREWYEAINAFDRVLQLFPEKDTRFEAMLWMARSYIEMDELENAFRLLQQYSSEIGDEKKYFVLEQSTYAWYWLVQERYDEALDYCFNAAENTGDRWEKIRWHFVLGQVAQRTGRENMAHEAFTRVIRLKPDYEITIHAMIEQALLEGGPDNPQKSRYKLAKYAEEYKNLDYRDQIYFAIAKTWLQEGDTLMALTNLELAAGYGGRNRILAGNIYKRMADVYFKSGNYVAAEAYYDSTLAALPSDYKDITEIEKIQKRLEPLAQSLRTIEYEDSVLRIAALPEEERNLFIDNLLTQMQQKEEESGFIDATDDAFFYRNFANRGNRETDESGNWYFYNQTMVSLGQMEFEKRWGRRKLEDNWRRSNKEAQEQKDDGNDRMMPGDPFADSQTVPGSDTPSDEETPQTGMPDRESLISGLPLTSEAKFVSHQKIQKSLFSAANILANNFKKYSEAVSFYKKLLSQYPETPYREQALTGIYLACREMNDQQCIQHYGEVITDDYPGSPFARFVNNPDYFENLDKLTHEMEEIYAGAYHHFKKGEWSAVIKATEPIFRQNYEPLLSQAALLNAFAYSQLNREPLFREYLQQIVDNFPETIQAEVAGYWLQQLNEGQLPGKIDLASSPGISVPFTQTTETTPSEKLPAGKFTEAPEATHYLMIIVDNETDINELMFQLANFNFDHFVTGGLQLESSQLSSDLLVLETGPFANKRIGLDYFFSLINQPSVFHVNNVKEPLVLIISDDNRRKIENATDLQDYKAFFLQKYLPGSDPSAVIINESEIPEHSYTEKNR
jgi:tetratricopeptide (TPR) repeat protein